MLQLQLMLLLVPPELVAEELVQDMVSLSGSGTDGLGGGGGGICGAATNNSNVGSTGGDGVVILRVATANVGTPSGHDSSATDGSDTVITWLEDLSYPA